MSAAKKLVHIASSDEEPHVLDIAGGRLPGPGQYESLVLRRSSTLRAHSQSWRFLPVRACVHMCGSHPVTHVGYKGDKRIGGEGRTYVMAVLYIACVLEIDMF